MPNPNDHGTYRKWIDTLMELLGPEKAMRAAPGGDFVAVGNILRDLVIQHGLKRDGYVIDVGCASGRLPYHLSEYLSGKYLGLDIVPELVDHARKLVQRPDWRFEVADGITIPERDNQADMVCFFSVFTHILHEHSYLYLKEATRVLKPSGKIIFSFLEYETAWNVFETAVQRLGDSNYPMTMFVERNAIRAWTDHLGLEIKTIVGAITPHVNLSRPVTYDNGYVASGTVPFGQSLCVLVQKDG